MVARGGGALVVGVAAVREQVALLQRLEQVRVEVARQQVVDVALPTHLRTRRHVVGSRCAQVLRGVTINGVSGRRFVGIFRLDLIIFVEARLSTEQIVFKLLPVKQT